MSSNSSRIEMFHLKYFFKNVFLALTLLRRGEVRRVFEATCARLYKVAYELIFWFKLPVIRAKMPALSPGALEVMTNYRVAFSSPDHLVPFGTKQDNSTNEKFVLHMNALVRSEFHTETPCFMDLGCSGGQLVKDFKDLTWIS